MDQSATSHPFLIKSCSLTSIATGEKASSLLDLRDKIARADLDCIYFHFWGRRLNPHFIHPEYHNDFAMWVHDCLHDQILAEQLCIIDPIEFDSLESLRQELIDRIEQRLDEHEIVLWTRKADQFHFIKSTILVFETNITIETPKNLSFILPKLPPSSIYYHFIDARARTPQKLDDFSVWLQNFGDQVNPLIESLQAIDPYFLSLTELRDELCLSVQHFLPRSNP